MNKQEPKSTTADVEAIVRKHTFKLIHELLVLTQSSRINWECTTYLPINLMPSDTKKSAYLTQCYVVRTRFNNKPIELQISDTVTVPEDYADLDIIDPDLSLSPLMTPCSLTYKYNTFCQPTTEEMLQTYRSDDITKLIDLIVAQTESSPCINDPTCNIKFNTEGYHSSVVDSPITRLGKCLHDQNRSTDFHKMVLDLDYRSKLYAEFNIH